MSRNVDLAPDEFYHVYNRGTDKRNIFLEEKDYERFAALLYICNGSIPVHLQLQGRTLKELGLVAKGSNLVHIGAYVLMPNHFHLLIKENEAGGISKFMQKLTTGYTMYFNKRRERTGALFLGKFKATHIDKDEYLKYLISYIHLNPVKLIEPKWKENGIRNKKRAERFLDKYRYSSYSDYAFKARAESVILERDAFPEYFEDLVDFKKNLKEWLEYQKLQGSTLK